MKLTISDKISFSIDALKAHKSLLILGFILFGLGSFLIYLGFTINNAKALLYIGGFIVVFMLFFFGYAMPSSLRFYYEKSLIKKYGSYTTASVIAKEIEDNNYTEHHNGKLKTIEEYNYLVEYQFTYNNKLYTNSFYVKSKSCFDKLEIDSKIPIKFLKVKPQQSEPRRRKLSTDLGLDIKNCS